MVIFFYVLQTKVTKPKRTNTCFFFKDELRDCMGGFLRRIPFRMSANSGQPFDMCVHACVFMRVTAGERAFRFVLVVGIAINL